MTILPRSPIWGEILEYEKTLTSLDHISENIVNKIWNSYMKFIRVSNPHGKKFSFETFVEEKITLKIPRRSICNSKTLKSKALYQIFNICEKTCDQFLKPAFQTNLVSPSWGQCDLHFEKRDVKSWSN